MAVLAFAPVFDQQRFNGQRGANTGHRDAAVEHLFNDCQAADSARDHHRHPRHAGQLASHFQKVGFPRQRAAVASFALHRRCFVAAAREFQQVDLLLVEPLDHLPGVVGVEAAALEIRRVELYRNTKLRRYGFTHRADHGQQQSSTILQRSAPVISAAIGQRRKELADQVTVRGMDLHTGKTGPFRQCGAGGEALDHLFNVGFVHRFRFGEHLRKRPQIQRHRRRCQGLLTEVGHGLAAGMIELHPELRTTGPANVRPLSKAPKVALILQHHAAGAGHGAAVDHHVAGQQQTGPALGPGLVQAKQRVVGRLIEIGQVFLHRGFGDAIADGLAVGQIQRLEGRHA
ncbi:hypothetical protein D3C86_619160 [compost metagenome]